MLEAASAFCFWQWVTLVVALVGLAPIRGLPAQLREALLVIVKPVARARQGSGPLPAISLARAGLAVRRQALACRTNQLQIKISVCLEILA